MTAVAGGVLPGVAENFASALRGSFGGGVLVNAVVIGSSPPIYKNEGYYSTGTIWEVWITIGAPSTFPPSAHALSYIHHDVLSQ